MGHIHENIKALRKQKGLSQKKMAESLEISESTYNRLENGEIDLAYQRHLTPIARIFEMEVVELFIFRNEKYIKMEKWQEIKNLYERLKGVFGTS